LRCGPKTSLCWKEPSIEPYMIHPLHATMILADMQTDIVCLITGVLHDTVEDTRG
jgi:GTP diphosphokinase / guanosine-3',5'-bis(diphosphate) 3'-diphosphatase